MAGGGGDGAEMMRQVLAAIAEYDPSHNFPLLLVLGPFMAATRAQGDAQARELPDRGGATSTTVRDDQAAPRVVGMGGYNTFCEIISFNKPP